MNVAASKERRCERCGGPGPLRWSGYFETKDGVTRVVKKFVCRTCEGPGYDPENDFRPMRRAA